MTVTDKLVRVFRVDNQIRGLRSRLTAAERFLAEQERQLGDIGTQRTAVESQLRQLKATVGNLEVESKQYNEKVEQLRERMNNAQSNKEYKALLTEVNTYKDEATKADETALGHMETIERLQTQLDELGKAGEERTKVRGVAEQERAQRADEIRERLAELEKERITLAEDVPDNALAAYAELVELRDEDAMAPIEIMDRKRHEFNCGSCMMSVPVETMSALLSHGGLTKCVNCGCILYLEESAREAMTAKR